MGRPGERYSQNPKTIQNKKRPKRTINETRGCYKAATINGKPTNGDKQTKKKQRYERRKPPIGIQRRDI
jgi:hypothetical protein